MRKILERYLLREVVLAWLVVSAVLLMILLTRTFADFLGDAAAGKFPPKALFSLVVLFSVQYLTIVIPLSLFLAVLLALGRWYRDSEMAALVACGGGPRVLLRPILIFTAVLALLLTALTFELSPRLAQVAEDIQRNAQQDAAIGLVEPGRFRAVPGGRGVFYVEEVGKQEPGDKLPGDNAAFSKLFVHLNDGNGYNLITANSGRIVTTEDGGRALQLTGGQRYDGQSGGAEFTVTEFGRHRLRVVAPAKEVGEVKPFLQTTAQLLSRGDREAIAELHGRLAVPLSLFILVLLAIPFAQVPPRTGSLGRMLPALLLFFLYFSLIGLGKEWLLRGTIPLWAGLWWVHLGVLLIVAWRWGVYLGWQWPRKPPQREAVL